MGEAPTDVEVVKIDIPQALMIAAAKAIFGKPPASRPKEHGAGMPWPQDVMTTALAQWTKFVGAILGVAGLRGFDNGELRKSKKRRKPRPRRVGAKEWRKVKQIEEESGIEGVRILRASLQLAIEPPSLANSLRVVLNAFQVTDEAKANALQEVLASFRKTDTKSRPRSDSPRA